MSSFTEPLIVKYLDSQRWELMRQFTYHVGWKDSDEIIVVSKGFITDFASIPKLFWSLIGGPTGRYSKAAVIHDFLYSVQTYTRQNADRIFYEAMNILNVPFFKRWLIYHSVRTWGHFPWRHHKKRLETINAEENTETKEANSEEN